jgi:SNF2 family DNA or RNA helicase
VMVVNYDVLYLLNDALTALMGRVKVGMALDECHKIRNPQAKVTKAAVSLAQHADWRLGMTGTPVLQGAQDIWSQWYVVDLGITFGANYVQFRREFLDENPYTFKLEAKPGALEEIGIRMRKRGLRFTKEECLDLPPKIYESIEVEMTPEQKRAYKQMEADLVAMLSESNDEYATASNQLAAILRLTQITSGFVPNETGEIHRFRPNPKLASLEEIVEEQIGAQQIIVWARYREDVRAIAERLAGFNPVLIQGGQSDQERRDAEEWFQSGERRLLVANPQAGGVGLNLQRASLAVYYSQGYSLEHRLQSEDRCHRSGSEVHNRVTYIDLVVKATIDEVITEALAGKKSVAEAVVDLRRAIGMEAA